MLELLEIYVDGAWIASGGDEGIEVLNPATESPIARVAAGSARDVDLAVSAARAAFPAWSALAPQVRADWLDKIAKELEAALPELASLAVADIGMPIDAAGPVQIGLPIFNFSNFAELARNLELEVGKIGHSMIVKEPVGVVACITPWNFPLFQIALKVGAALAAGCTVVLKPSEVAPLLAFRLAEIVDAIGLPKGVFNLVSGGAAIGEALVRHEGVDMVSFTGSTSTGKRIAAQAASTVKKVTLELGGKSANVILDDADLQAAVTDGVAKCFLNSGQVCIALSRMLVPAERLAEAEAIAAAAVTAFAPGDPGQPGTLLGPLASAAQLARVRAHIQAGLDEGARLVVGGLEVPEGRGYFVAPTVFSDVTPDMSIAREEIFGPVLVIMPYADEAEAVRLANDSPYGLAGSVWSSDADRALRVARQLQAGLVDVNGAAYNPAAPYGGYKQSGYGREGGLQGVEEFLQSKSIQLPD